MEEVANKRWGTAEGNIDNNARKTNTENRKTVIHVVLMLAVWPTLSLRFWLSGLCLGKTNMVWLDLDAATARHTHPSTTEAPVTPQE